MIEIIGKNGSGKTFVANELGRRGYEKIVGYTTRPMRSKEINGFDYNFVSEEKFKNMIENGEFLEYKIRNGNYYGISKNGITNNSIITSGNSELISEKTGFDVCKIYLDVNLRKRYSRMTKRNPEDNLFERVHSENFSFLNDFKALFIENSNGDSSIIDYIESVIKDGIIPNELLLDNKLFLEKKVKEFESVNHVSSNFLLDFLEYEEYMLRRLTVMDNIDEKIDYYNDIADYIDKQKGKEDPLVKVLTYKKINNRRVGEK